METSDIIIIIIIVSFFLFVLYQQLKLLNNRYLRGYKKEINEELERRGLRLAEINYPNKLDWKASPFRKPKTFQIKLLIITINGMIVTWNKKDHKIITAVNKQNKERLIWLEVDTTYFQKPYLSFKDGIRSKENKQRKEKTRIIQIGNNCPACGFKIQKTDTICPDCGLYFN